MENINGTYSVFYIKIYNVYNPDGVYLPVGCLTNNSFSESVEMLDTKVRTNENGWGSSRPIGQSYNIELSGLVTKESLVDGVVTYYQIQKLKRDRELIEWKIEGGVNIVEYGSAYFTSLSKPASIDEFISFTASLKGQGKPVVNPQIEGGLGHILGHKL